MATTLDDLIEQTRQKANVQRSNFVTDPEIIGYLNEARKEFRELVIAADDSYYQATLEFNLGAQPDNVQALPADFWKMRGLDAFGGDSLRQTEVYAREFRNRFEGGLGYYFGGDGNSLVVVPGQTAAQFNPYLLTYTPRVQPLAALVPGETRSITHDVSDGTNAGTEWLFANGSFSAGDIGATFVVSGSGTALDGTYTIATIVSGTSMTTIPVPTGSLIAGGSTVATVTDADDASRTFAVAPTDSSQSGYLTLQNGAFGPSDLNSFLALDVGSDTYDGTYTIIQVVSSTLVRVTPAIAGNSGSLTGTASIGRQPADTQSELDAVEDGFSEYFSVRAATTIARKKRQDTLVAQLTADRTGIEMRISAMAPGRQSEPQQAPVLWRPGLRSRFDDDMDV